MRTDIANHTDWELKRIKYLATYNDEVLPDNTEPDVEINYIEISDVDHVNGITNTQKLAFEKAPSRARRIVRKGDTIVSTVRTYLKAIAYVDDEYNGSIASTGFAVIRSIDEKKIHPKYLGYCFQDKRLLGDILSNSVGVSYPAINASALVRLSVYKPSYSEQILIALFLDQKTGQIDKLIEQKEKLLKLLAEKRTAIITQAVTKGLDPKVEMKDSGVDWLGEIPKHWEVIPLKFQLKSLNKKRIPLSAEERGPMNKKYPYYGASGIIDYVEDFIFNEDLILIAEDGANLLSRSTPLAFVATGKYWVNNHAHILEADSATFGFWSNLLCIIDYTPWITGAAQPKLTQENLGNIPLPLPPKTEQLLISDFIQKEITRFDPLIVKLKNSILKLKEYREALITSAVTGQIDVRKVVGHE